jgi:hypothetical protein
MDDQRVVGGATFGAKDLPTGICVEGICGEAVNRFSGHRNQTSAPEDPRQPAQIFGSSTVDSGRGRHGSVSPHIRIDDGCCNENRGAIGRAGIEYPGCWE